MKLVPARAWVLWVLLAAVACLAPASAAADVDPVGPALGNNRYRGTISTETDADFFTGRLMAGETLTVSVAAQRAPKAKVPTLQPILVLVDPSGIERTAGITTARNQFSAAAKAFAIDETGLWTVRVTGRDGTTGDYLAAFRIKPLAKVVLKKRKLGGSQPTTLVHEVPGFDGSRLDALLVTKKGGTPVELAALLDPSGAEVLGTDGKPATDHVVSKAGGLRRQLRGAILRMGAGDYGVRVRIPQGTAQYDLTLTVTPAARPAGRKIVTLSATEPVLAARGLPHVADPGETVTFTGTGFSVSPPPTVFFGRAKAASVTTSDDGTSLDVVVPPRAGPAVVPVYVVNPDGQGMGRDAYFAYLPPPVVTDVVDDTTGAPVRSVSAAGGRVLRIVGRNFDPGFTVRVGATVAAGATFLSATEYRFTVPAVAQGSHGVSVADPFGRIDVSSFSVFFKTPPAFAAAAYSPLALPLNSGATVVIHGTGFTSTDRLIFRGAEHPSTFLGGTTRSFDVPPLTAGDYTVRLVDSIGTEVDGPPLTSKLPPTLGSVVVVAGPLLPGVEIPAAGGSTIEVTGTSFHWADVVTLGGATVTNVVSRTPTKFRFVAPPASPGVAAIVVTDGAGQSASLAGVVRYVGFRDQSSARAPAKTSADDFSALRAAAGDLDGDGLEDDVVLVSPIGSTIGTRTTLTRVLFGDASGKLQDATASAVPAPRQFTGARDDWDANCVAVGDLDGANGPEIVLGGQIVASGGSSTYRQVRLFKNDGSGTFSDDTINLPPSRDAGLVLGAYYYYGLYYYPAYGPTSQQGVPRAIALGDIDRDPAGTIDMVVGTDHFQERHVYYDTRYVAYYPGIATPIFTMAPYYYYLGVNYEQYLPATRVMKNRIGEGLGFEDATLASLPRVGTTKSTTGQPAALHCRDLALADVDRDGYLDLIVAWDDPLSVTASGLKSKLAGGSGQAQPDVATRILLNDQAGNFPSDVTASWMPPGQLPEFLHADRILVRDLNGDAYPELILLLSKGLDAWTGVETHTRRALRVLRNDQTKFTNVSSTALPDVAFGSGEDYRGTALAVEDVNSDGFLDIVVSTQDALKDPTGANAPRTRTFFGGAGLTFTFQPAFFERPQTDTGEASELLFVGDLGGGGPPVMLLTGPAAPATSPGTTPVLRGEEWRR